MKKMLIAAIAAAMTVGATADLCDVDDTNTSSCAAWNLTFKLKALKPAKVNCKDKGACEACGDTVKWCETYLKKGTRTIQGLLWMCESQCFFDDNATIADNINMVLWEKAYSIGWGIDNTGLYIKDKQYAGMKFADLGGQNLASCFRFGKKANDVAMAFDIAGATPFVGAGAGKGYKARKVVKNEDGSREVEELSGEDLPYASALNAELNLTAAGFGTYKYDKKAQVGYIKSVSGNCAGTLTPVCYGGVWCENPSAVVDLCEDFTSYCDGVSLTTDGVAAPAYGTWNMKFNSSLAKGKKKLTSMIPAYSQE